MALGRGRERRRRESTAAARASAAAISAAEIAVLLDHAGGGLEVKNAWH